MALYRTGTATMDAQGVITGTGTKWREPLSLIRTGATIVFLTTPLKLAVISDIVSDTEMKAIQTDGDPVANGNYVIMLNDSLTVDGMAQDVAETLRYYQSKETVIEEAIEFFKNFDIKQLQDLIARAEASAQKTDADRAATEQLKNDTQAIKDAAVNETQQIKDTAVAETNQIKADTNAIKDQTQGIKDAAVRETEAIKQEAFNARDESETARDLAEQSKIAADSAKAGAETARDEAKAAQFAAEQSKVGADSAKAGAETARDLAEQSKIAADSAKAGAETARDEAKAAQFAAEQSKVGAETARDEARQWAQQVNPENLLNKDQNLNDLENKDLAREALKVEAVNSVKDQYAGAYNSFRNPEWTYELRIANNGEWRVARNSDSSTYALSVGAGGTGAENVTQARNNFGIGEADVPVFMGVHLIEKNGSKSGLVYLTNRDANGNDVSNSRIYNEIQGGLSKTTIHTFSPGGRNSYLQIDERGYLSNFSSLAIGVSDHVLGENAIAIGDNNSGLKWDRDGHISAFANSERIFSWTPSEINPYSVISSYVDDNARGVYVNGVRRGESSALIAGQVEGGKFDAWRNRACGMLVELPADDTAVNVFKAVRWGGDWVAGLDVARYGTGVCEAHLNVRGTSYKFNDDGYATAVQWINTCDIRLKANLKEIKRAKDKVKSIKGYTYFKRNSLEEDENSFYSEEAGVIAQDVQTVLPEAVYKISDSEILGVSYGGVTALLVNAVNEMIDESDKQNEIISKQQDEIKELKNEVAEMKKMIAQMQEMFIQNAK